MFVCLHPAVCLLVLSVNLSTAVCFLLIGRTGVFVWSHLAVCLLALSVNLSKAVCFLLMVRSGTCMFDCLLFFCLLVIEVFICP